MDGILEPLGEPVGAEGDEHDQAGDLGVAAARGAGAACRIVVAWRELDVDGGEGERYAACDVVGAGRYRRGSVIPEPEVFVLTSDNLNNNVHGELAVITLS